MGGMWISSLVVIVLLVLLVWWAAGGARGRARETRDSAEDALRLRYARGEIDRDEYERRLSDLRK